MGMSVDMINLWLRDARRAPEEIATIASIAKIAEIEKHSQTISRRLR
jgi:hypothetical protein